MNLEAKRPAKKPVEHKPSPQTKPVHVARNSMEEIEIRAQTKTEVLRRILTFPLRPVAS